MANHLNENTFDDTKIVDLLGSSVLDELKTARENLQSLSKETYEAIAAAMQKWALDKGATHYTHWFQPLGGTTAEKLLPLDGSSSYANKDFSAKNFLNSESDASSFPSGGLRSTFEARGISSWDYNSPAFLKQVGKKLVLYIPTIFTSPHGETLDKKLPLLRSMKLLQNEVGALLKALEGVKGTVINNVGVEQEFFLVEKDKAREREDLSILGRTLFETEDKNLQFNIHHYSSSLSERIGCFFDSLNDELEKLGIVPCAEHREASPNQFEVALMYAPSNIMLDHNQILVDTIKTEADHYNLSALFDEKPFEGVNGSGKHTNWSISFNGENLFTPGKNGEKSLRFLLFIALFVRSVDKYGSLLLSSIASRSNEFRLGHNEAPPMVISMFLGEELTSLFKKSNEELLNLKFKANESDADRNRTSPLAFTNGKFEFRAVGSSQSISSPVTFLNTAFAESAREARKRIEKASDKKQECINVIKDFWKKHNKVVYNGNGYSQEWQKESKKRSLKSIESAPEGFMLLGTKENVALLTENQIFSPKEIASRINVNEENYKKTVMLEATIIRDMINKHILPATLKSIELYGKAKETSETKKFLELMASRYMDFLAAVNYAENRIPKDVQMSDEFFYAFIKSVHDVKEDLSHGIQHLPKEYITFPLYDDLLLLV